MAGDFLTTLEEGMKEIGIEPSEEMLNKYALYHRELKRWSRAYNITGLRDDRDMAIRLFLDSLLYLEAFPPASGDTRQRVLDVGSGGGFPGVVLKIARPDLRVTLLEPSWKKAGFLRHLCKRLSLSGVTVVQSTLEELARTGGEPPYDIIVTRALLKTYDLIKKTGGLLARGGILVLSKGPVYADEMEEAAVKLGDRLKGYRIERVSRRLPLAEMERHLIKVTRL